MQYVIRFQLNGLKDQPRLVAGSTKGKRISFTCQIDIDSAKLEKPIPARLFTTASTIIATVPSRLPHGWSKSRAKLAFEDLGLSDAPGPLAGSWKLGESTERLKDFPKSSQGLPEIGLSQFFDCSSSATAEFQSSRPGDSIAPPPQYPLYLIESIVLPAYSSGSTHCHGICWRNSSTRFEVTQISTSTVYRFPVTVTGITGISYGIMASYRHRSFNITKSTYKMVEDFTLTLAYSLCRIQILVGCEE